MTMPLNETHDPSLTSWVASANAADTDFPIQNLPFAVFRRRGSAEALRVGVAIGEQVLDLTAAVQAGVFDGAAQRAAQAACADRLNALMALGAPAWSALRLALSRLLRTGAAAQARLAGALVPQAEAAYALPARIGDYTDFYIGIHHATAVGKQFRPDNPLLPNYKWVPIGYHGRASSIVVGGTPVRRPNGQTKGPADEQPAFGPSRRMDYELELGFLVGPGNALGEPIPIARAEQHLFGAALFNDWSARDIQPWEYQPLGPFLSKNFGSTLAPWVVTMEALAPFRAPFAHPAGDPAPLPYLDCPANRSQGGLDVHLEVWLQSARMREAGQAPLRLSHGNMREAAYWTAAQLVAHHTAGGCNLNPGDLLGSGTLSGPGAGQNGSLLELTRGGTEPIALPSGESRGFLADGDTVELRAWCERAGARRIGFGACSGTVLPAPAVAAA
ncbi:fumarylacetoacetase [Pseudorhodoferax sp.]|uniref:fumarylacetoacetase n=1 Tax=Pseudorhodoferax sp. TaxID=1993553 RepID=UPI0039E70798